VTVESAQWFARLDHQAHRHRWRQSIAERMEKEIKALASMKIKIVASQQ
jgi:hypothetical protein